MKIQLFSDVHLETKTDTSFTKNDVSKEADLIIVPGDFHHINKAIPVLQSIIYDHQQVIYVPGNHEYYFSTMSKVKVKSEGPVHLLNNSSITIDNINFIGSTLWTDFLLFGIGSKIQSIFESKKFLNDYNYINVTKDIKWNPYLAEDEFYRCIKFIEKELSKKTKNKRIVVTHHSPSLKSSSDIYKSELLTSSFASDLEEFIFKYKPDYWFHGHVHNSMTYNIGDTVIAVNSFGYQNENVDYKSHYIFDLDK